MNNDYSESGGNNCERCISGAGIPALNGFPLAMAYSPNQDWENILEPEEALSKGTLFTGLLFPWYPSRCHDNKDCGCGRG
ncbi:MAG: spore coat associated protein CotJA [Clostridia bacterium]|nr:spore coat associated protein CotJA [Clostridia bacterium]